MVLGGRWKLGPGHTLYGEARVHGVAPLDDRSKNDLLVELHPMARPAVGPAMVDAVRAAAIVADPALVSVVDAGLVEADGNGIEHVFVVTDGWDELLGSAALPEEPLRQLAAALAGGLAALHRSGLDHGCLHRGTPRLVGDRWMLGPAGLAPVAQAAIAPYRPPGLNVMEPPSPAADMWNLGVLLHELGNGRLVRPGEEPSVEGVPVVDHLVKRLLVSDPAARPPAEEVLELLEATPLHQAPPAALTPTPALSSTPAPSSTPRGSAAPPTRRLWPETPADDRGAPSDPSDVAPGGRPSRRGPLLVLIGTAAVALVIAAGLSFASGSDGDDDDGERVATEPTATEATTPAAGPTATPPVPADELGDGRTVGLADLLVGDCVDLALGQGVIGEATTRPCDAGHTAEVIAVGEPPAAASGSDYPGRQGLTDFGRGLCRSEFGPYVGAELFETVLGEQAIVPTFGEWDSGERRSVICIVTRYDGAPLASSVANGFQEYRLVQGATTSVGKLLPSICFNREGPALSTTGLRQDVEVVGCPNLHSFEVYHFDTLPLGPDDETVTRPEPERFTVLVDQVRDICEERWAELTPLPGATDGRRFQIVPDSYDWLVGERTFRCVVEWSSPLLNSVVLTHNLATDTDPATDTDTTTKPNSPSGG